VRSNMTRMDALRKWMSEHRLTTDQVAGKLGCTTRTVGRYLAGERIPDRVAMTAIYKLTEGRVTANDFYGLSSADGQRAA